jgi:hypothetical protein
MLKGLEQPNSARHLAKKRFVLLLLWLSVSSVPRFGPLNLFSCFERRRSNPRCHSVVVLYSCHYLTQVWRPPPRSLSVRFQQVLSNGRARARTGFVPVPPRGEGTHMQNPRKLYGWPCCTAAPSLLSARFTRARPLFAPVRWHVLFGVRRRSVRFPSVVVAPEGEATGQESEQMGRFCVSSPAGYQN